MSDERWCIVTDDDYHRNQFHPWSRDKKSDGHQSQCNKEEYCIGSAVPAMGPVVETNTPPQVGDIELHDHEHDRCVDIPCRGGLIDRDGESGNDHYLPEGHQPGAKAFAAVDIIIQTTIQPTPE